MTSGHFRNHLRGPLEQHSDRTLLRIVTGGEIIELTGAVILQRSVGLARRYQDAPEVGVVLLLLPHSLELFLLHLGLILEGRIPAILAWPTSRVDPQKYQRNLLHQLRNLSASQVITLPRLAQNMERHRSADRDCRTARRISQGARPFGAARCSENDPRPTTTSSARTNKHLTPCRRIFGAYTQRRTTALRVQARPDDG